MKRAAQNREVGQGLDWASLRPVVTDDLLQGIARRIVDRFAPEQIILFGSYVSGEPDLDSDIDLFVIMESDESMARRMSRVTEVAHVRFLPMDVLVYTPAEVERRLALGDPFVREILSRGRVLYEHEPSRRVS